jgi:Na+/proline symporter
MKPAAERKVLTEFLKIANDPARAEKRFRRYAQMALTLFVLIIFYFLSDNSSAGIVSIGLAFGAGLALGLGIWFLQASTQTGLMVRHLSRESIVSRLDEIGEA